MTQLFDSVTMKVSDLIPHPRNYRTHPEDQVRHLMQSIKDHGFYRNVVVANDNTILAGHGVVEAASQMGMTEISVVKLDIDPFSTQALKVLTGDNYISSTAMDDDRMLSEILKEIRDDASIGSGEENLIGTGFDDMQLANFLMVTRHKNEIADFDAAAEWAGAGAPEFDCGPQEQHVTVRFMGEEAREKFLEHLGLEDRHVSRKGSKVTFWWPPRERGSYDGVRVEPTEEEEAPEKKEPTERKSKRGKQRNETLDEVLAVMKERNEKSKGEGLRTTRPFLFVKVPRTASESMSGQFASELLDYVRIGKAKVAREFYEATDRTDLDHLCLCHNHLPPSWLIHEGILPTKRWRELLTFAFVRNPWDRAVSLWRLQTSKGQWEGDGSFIGYLRHLVSKRKKLINFEYGSPHYAISSPQMLWMMPDFDFIGQYERLDSDFTNICEQFGIPNYTLRRHTSLHGGNKKKVNHVEMYEGPEGEEADRIVRDLYAVDIETLGYDGPGTRSRHDDLRGVVRDALIGRSGAAS